MKVSKIFEKGHSNKGGQMPKDESYRIRCIDCKRGVMVIKTVAPVGIT